MISVSLLMLVRFFFVIDRQFKYAMDFGIDDVSNVSTRGKTTIITVFENMTSVERRQGGGG